MFTAQQILLNLWRTSPNVDNTSHINGNYVYWTFTEDTSEPYIMGSTSRQVKSKYIAYCGECTGYKTLYAKL